MWGNFSKVERRYAMSYKSWGIAFPSILDGLGPEQVMAEAANMGQSEFILCSIIYSGYRLVMPRHPRQIYQLETGMTFYPADESAYKGCLIRPVSTRDYAGRDLFIEASKAAAKYSISLHAWVSCFANGRVAKEYPEAAVENLYGSRDRLFLCFNNPETRKFVLAMFGDLASRYPLAGLMADKIPQSMLELRAFGGQIDPLLRLVGSICFCDYCMTQAKKDGIDLPDAKRLALKIAEASRKVPQYVREGLADDLQGDTEVPLFLLEERLFAEVLRWRIETVARFLSQVRGLVKSIQPEIKLSACLVPPVKIGHDTTSPRAWLGAQSYRIFAPVVDAIHSVIHWNSDVVEYDTRRARDQIDAGNTECELCTHVAAYGRRRPEEMERLVQAALGQGAESIAFFCHDLMDDRMMSAVKMTQR
jgi:uncharacterized lipoprotein YddW (UPF0748 family)